VTQTDTMTPDRRIRSPWVRRLLILVVVGVILIGALGAWYLFLRPAPPPPVGPEAPVIPALVLVWPGG
jgi:hypothetical protein